MKGRYITTAKNKIVGSFLESVGFEIDGDGFFSAEVENLANANLDFDMEIIDEYK